MAFAIGFSLYRAGRLTVARKMTARETLELVRDLQASGEVIAYVKDHTGADVALTALAEMAAGEAR